MIKPKQLNKGDKIAIVSLSSGILGDFNNTIKKSPSSTGSGMN